MARTRSKLLAPVTLSSSGRYRTKEASASSWGSWISPGAANGNSFRQDAQTMTDQKTPGYFRAVRENSVIPTSPMNSVKTEYICVPGAVNAIVQQTSGGRLGENSFSGYFWPGDDPWAIAPVPPSVDGNVALQQALARAQADCYDALTFAAEFRKTVEGVVTLRSRAMTLWERFDSRVRSSSRRKRFRGMEVSQILAEIWLELRYMWRPLVYDMMAMQEAIRRLAQGIEDPLQRAYATLDGSVSSSRVIRTGICFVDGSRGGPWGMSTYSAQTCVVERSVHAAVGLKVTTRDVYMTDPIVTAWELVPFSFVLDWFVTIGDMLTAFSPFATGQLQYATLATKTVSTFRTITTMRASSGFTTVSNSSSPCEMRKVVTDYRRVRASPVPTLAVDVNLNVSKILDLTALWLTINRSSLTRLLRHF